MTAAAVVGGQRYSQQRIEINYPHIPLQLLQPPARARLLCTEVAKRGQRVGYLAERVMTPRLRWRNWAMR
jgi:hypothetical protein